MANASGDRADWTAPRQLRGSIVERSAVASLSDDTVAQIVTLLHKRVIQVNDALPRGLHAAIVRHVAEHHEWECIARACPQARAWLADHGTGSRPATLLA